MGNIHTTVSGRTCQAWTQDSPHYHYWTDDDSLFPDGNVSSAGNKCRNPRSWYEGVWCLTTDPNMTWERCDIPLCSGECT